MRFACLALFLVPALASAELPEEVDKWPAAIEAMITKDGASPELAKCAQRLSYFGLDRCGPLMRKIIAGAKSEQAQAAARVGLANLLTRSIEIPGDPATAKRTTEARALFEEVRTRYARVDGGAFARQAESGLYELDHLLPGRLAPDIEGEDLEGKPLKLSAHRGRVVVIAFWGDW